MTGKTRRSTHRADQIPHKTSGWTDHPTPSNPPPLPQFRPIHPNSAGFRRPRRSRPIATLPFVNESEFFLMIGDLTSIDSTSRQGILVMVARGPQPWEAAYSSSSDHSLSVNETRFSLPISSHSTQTRHLEINHSQFSEPSHSATTHHSHFGTKVDRQDRHGLREMSDKRQTFLHGSSRGVQFRASETNNSRAAN
jgi:hypothetical protein